MAKHHGPPAERLREAAKGRGWNQTELSEQLGVSTGVVSRWLKGQRVPCWSSALKIERLLGIPARLWLEADEARRAS